MKKIFEVLIIVAGFSNIIGCATTELARHPASAQAVQESVVKPISPGNISLDDLVFFKTPEDGHATWIKAIGDARDSIWMEMFHLTDKAVIQALEKVPEFVKITLILDVKNASEGDGMKFADELKQKTNINVVLSSKKFEITHSKAMIVDVNTPNEKAFITSINLTNAAAKTRDYGIITTNNEIIQQLLRVFQADVTNSQNLTNDTPDITENHLIFAPVPDSAKAKLRGLIQSAAQDLKLKEQKFIYATVENLVDKDIEQDFIDAAKAGIDVRIIVPMCDENPNSSLNFGPITFMKQNGVQNVRMMPNPNSVTHPYMHGKMMVLGNNSGYLGSENYSPSSLFKSRETGILFNNATVAQGLIDSFKTDWENASEPAMCPSSSKKPVTPSATSSNSENL